MRSLKFQGPSKPAASIRKDDRAELIALIKENYNATREYQKQMLENQREFLQFYKRNETIKAEKYTVIKERLDSLLIAVGSLQTAVEGLGPHYIDE